MTSIPVGDINLGNNYPNSELIYDVIMIFKKMSNIAHSFPWIVSMFLAIFGKKYCSNTVVIIKWPPLFHIWAIWEKYQFWPTKFFSRSKSRSKVTLNLTLQLFYCFWHGMPSAIFMKFSEDVSIIPNKVSAKYQSSITYTFSRVKVQRLKNESKIWCHFLWHHKCTQTLTGRISGCI